MKLIYKIIFCFSKDLKDLRDRGVVGTEEEAAGEEGKEAESS